ncbi:hypothetical protein [Mixta intestinalis]|uniref:Uncharacterized protein n=1 Tax=Mixta intestinalis TaxID=1615494 RepID=A0A6P1PYC0_9GAMM|nr:hypothetical protein [Mixta intestinalis]QHM70798.1 hypothetical protein C7M51_01078 [Mixta intestinalis]
MSFSRSLFDERDETLDALEESLIAVGLPGRQALHLSAHPPVNEHYATLHDPLYEADERIIWR